MSVVFGVSRLVAALRDSVSEVFGIPVDDNRRKEIEPVDPEMLALGRPIANLTLASKGLLGFALYRFRKTEVSDDHGGLFYGTTRGRIIQSAGP